MQTPLQALAEAEIRNVNSLAAARRVLEVECGIQTDADRDAMHDYTRSVVARIQAGGTLLSAPNRPR